MAAGLKAVDAGVARRARLTYGVSTYLASRKYADLLLGQFASANDRMAEAVDILRKEWDEIARNGISETELQLAQTYLTGALSVALLMAMRRSLKFWLACNNRGCNKLFAKPQ